MGRGSSERWRRDDEGQAPPPPAGMAARSALLSVRRGRSNNADHLPEWATDEAPETGGGEAGGTFDESGKFRAEQNKLNGVR